VASPAFSRHAFIEVAPAGAAIRLFGLHLSAVHAAWTERRRVFELRSLLRSIAEHPGGFHVLAVDFNTLAPGEDLDLKRLPPRLRPFVWLSGGRIRWRTIREVVAAGYVGCVPTQTSGRSGPDEAGAGSACAAGLRLRAVRVSRAHRRV
jgi:hypothetical protein